MSWVPGFLLMQQVLRDGQDAYVRRQDENLQYEARRRKEMQKVASPAPTPETAPSPVTRTLGGGTGIYAGYEFKDGWWHKKTK